LLKEGTGMEDVYVTGTGIVSAIGHDTPSFWAALVQGTSGVAPITRFNTTGLLSHLAAEIRDFPKPSPYLLPEEISHTLTTQALLFSVGREALAAAGLLSRQMQSLEPALEIAIGSNLGDFVPLLEKKSRELKTGEPAEITRVMVPLMLSDNAFRGLLFNLARRLNAGGMQCILSNACAAGAYAISLAAERIRQGKTAAALCGGVEILSEVVFSGFSNLRALAPDCCRPFDKNRQGMVFGEAAAAVILESKTSLLARGGRPLAKLSGWGWSTDAHHLSAPHPEGHGTVLALRRALARAGLAAADINCLVAHGTGTPSNDRMEARAFTEVFGKNPPPVTAPKSILGHSIGAASAVEALVGVKITQTGIIPPTINFQTPDPECALDCVPNVARRQNVLHCQTNASSFGGNNVSLIFTQPDF
jgi:3-oxoacyl-[acyl-carrier-protein] synthase II